MPGILCKCGETLRYGEIPCPIEWLIISDVDFDKYVGSIDSESLYKDMKNFLKCPKCQRIWIYWNGYNNPPTEYIQCKES